jgi:hypothetical protein
LFNDLNTPQAHADGRRMVIAGNAALQQLVSSGCLRAPNQRTGPSNRESRGLRS